MIALGISDVGPAHYLEILKYAIEYFNPDQVIIFVCLANDFRNVLHDAQAHLHTRYQPQNYIYYEINQDGNLEILPESKVALLKFNLFLRRNHEHPIKHAKQIIANHCITLRITKTILGNYATSKKNQITNVSVGDGFQSSGINGFIFEKNQREYAGHAMLIATKLLEESRHYANLKGVDFGLVTIPHFSSDFYSQNEEHGNNWNSTIEDYDFLLPERLLEIFADSSNIPILAMGEYMQKDKLSAEKIKELYLVNGIGHLTQKGHQYFAEAVFKTLFESNAGLNFHRGLLP